VSLVPKIRITWPTLLTLLRFVLIPLIVFLLVKQSWGWAAVFFATAMLTDFFDGFVARKFHLTTKFGAILDGLADKFLMLSLLITFLFVPTLLPQWFVYLVLIKELIVLCAAVILLQRKYVIIIAPLKLGKFTMAAEMALFLWMILARYCGIPFYMVAVKGVALLIGLTLFGYLMMVLRLRRKHNA